MVFWDEDRQRGPRESRGVWERQGRSGEQRRLGRGARGFDRDRGTHRVQAKTRQN